MWGTGTAFQGSREHAESLPNSLLQSTFSSPLNQLRIAKSGVFGTFVDRTRSFFDRQTAWRRGDGLELPVRFRAAKSRGLRDLHLGKCVRRRSGRFRPRFAMFISHNEGKRMDVFAIRNSEARIFYKRLGFEEQTEWCLYRIEANA